MRDAESVITDAVNGRTKELAKIYEVSEARMFQLLSTHCPYAKAKLLIRAIAQVNPGGTRIIKADLDAMFQDLLGHDPDDVSIAELHRECTEALQANLDGKPIAVQQKETRDAIAVLSQRLRDLERPAYKELVTHYRKKAAVH